MMRPPRAAIECGWRALLAEGRARGWPGRTAEAVSAFLLGREGSG